MSLPRRPHLRPERLLGLLVAIGAAFAPAASSDEGTVIQALPGNPDPGVRWVFYLHGRIIEEAGPRPTHPELGVYEYEEILENLAGRSDPNAIERVGRRLLGTGLLRTADRRRLRRILERSLPDRDADRRSMWARIQGK